MPAKHLSRVALYIALLLGLAGLLVFKGIVRSQSANKQVGIVWVPTELNGMPVGRVAPGSPADRAGIQPGDVIVAVNGVRLLKAEKSYQQMARKFQRGNTVVFQVQRGGSIIDLRVSPGVTPRWGYFLVDTFSALCCLALVFLALSPGVNRDLRARLLVGSAGTTALLFAIPIYPTGFPWLANVLQVIFYLVGGVQIAFEIHLAALIAGRLAVLRRWPLLVPVNYAVFLGAGLLALATDISSVLDKRLFPWSVLQIQGMLRLLSWLGTLVVLVVLSRQVFCNPKLKERTQAGLVLAATVLSIFTLAFFNAMDLTPSQRFLGASIQSLFYSGAYFVAIFRYDLFDIERVVRRSFIYTALTAGLVLVFYVAQGAAGIFLTYAFGGGGSVWAVALATLLLGLLFVPLRRSLHRTIGERFFPERHALRQRLVSLAGELPAFGKLPRMGEHLVTSIQDLFLTRSVTLLLADPEASVLRTLASTEVEGKASPRTGDFLLPLEDTAIDHLRRNRSSIRMDSFAPRSAHFARHFKDVDPASLIVPLLNQKKLVGVLIVGPKAVGSYPAEELDLLNLLAHHVAIVFENARLFESATYEGLTGLLRREAILDHLEGELERAQRYGRPLSIAIADLDHFKSVNDRYGHLAGDTLLRHVSQVIANELRSSDRIGRYGGEEFLLVFPETDIEQAGMVAEKVRAIIEKTSVTMEDEVVIRATVSIGIASLHEVSDGEEPVSARDLIAAADRALYCAKDCGRNRVHPQIPVLQELAG